MKTKFKPGDQKVYERRVERSDVAEFETGKVHPVYSTFSLARDAEWACRLFVLEMKDQDEEGIGTHITINHYSPALIGSKVSIVATVKSIVKNEIVCEFEARIGDRLLADGEQTQKILPIAKIEGIFEGLNLE